MKLSTILFGLATVLFHGTVELTPHPQPANVPLPNYDATVKVDTARASLAAKVTIMLPASEVQAANEFQLGSTYEISSVNAGPQTTVEIMRPEKLGVQKIIIRCQMPRRADLLLQLSYGGPLTVMSTPPINSITPELIELSFDSYWLPVQAVSQRFTLKADIIGVPTGMVVVANGDVRRNDAHVLITRPTGDIDLAWVAIRGLQRRTADGFELDATDPTTDTANIYFRHGAAAIKYLEAWFGPMPGRPVHVVVVKRERKSGYARPGYIVVTERPAADSPREAALAKFISHEFSHAWWSCPPCDPRTENRWLSESIAEYLALRYVEAALGHETLQEALAAKRIEAAKAGPLLGGGERGDPELYNKGPLLLFDLEAKIGRSRMDKLLAGMAPHPPPDTAGFLRELAAAAGEEASREFDQAMRR